MVLACHNDIVEQFIELLEQTLVVFANDIAKNLQTQVHVGLKAFRKRALLGALRAGAG